VSRLQRSVEDVLLFPGAHEDRFAMQLAETMGVKLSPVKFERFLSAVPGGEETKPEVLVNVHDRIAVIVWSVTYTNDELVQVCQLVDALKSAGEAHKVVLVVPSYPYSRQDKRHGRRESITAQLTARLLEASGLDSIIYVDIHADQIEGFFRDARARGLWMDEIYMHFLSQRLPEIAAYLDLTEANIRDMPLDEGSVNPNYRVARKLGHSMAIHIKKRNWDSRHSVHILGIAGDVVECLIYSRDDILASGDSIFTAAAEAKKRGAKYVLALVTHALGFDKPGHKAFAEKLRDSAVDELVVSNSQYSFVDRVMTDIELQQKVSIIDITPYLAEVIERHIVGDTVREMMAEVKPEDLYRVLFESEQARKIRANL
jgi:ribose-phosphate pyrophosphokinase